MSYEHPLRDELYFGRRCLDRVLLNIKDAVLVLWSCALTLPHLLRFAIFSLVLLRPEVVITLPRAVVAVGDRMESLPDSTSGLGYGRSSNSRFSMAYFHRASTKKLIKGVLLRFEK